jgi:Tfp pilus assembly protein PilF
VAVVIAAATIAVFWPALDAGFLAWDDEFNLVQNTGYRGLTATHLRWMFTATVMGHYIPLTWLSFGIDYTLWGMDPRGYHFTNLVLHLGTVLAFFSVAHRLLRQAMAVSDGARLLGAAAATLFFAVHPLRAESVAWVTERRDVLSGLLFLLTILSYLAAQEREGRRRRVLLGASIVAYAGAALSKSIVMGLPLLLLILDVYPLRRLHVGARMLSRSRGVLLEKIPFVVIGVACAATSYYVVKTFTVLTTTDVIPWTGRVAMVFYTLWFYVSRTVAPVSLSPLYELPLEMSLWQPRFALAAVGATVLTVAFVALRRRWPAGLAVWLTYMVVLAPISGVVHAGHQLAHDRYSYLSCLGWALLLGGAVGAVATGKIPRLGLGLRRIALASVAVWLIALAWMGSNQVRVWHDALTLWTHAIDSEPDCAICHGNLAAQLVRSNDAAGAMRHAQRALALRPDRPRPYSTVGLALVNDGRPEEAIPYFEAFLERDPNSPEGVGGLGLALLRSGRPREALGPLRRAAVLKPNDTVLRLNYAAVLVALGDRDAARAEYRAILEFDPNSVEARHTAKKAGFWYSNPNAIPHTPPRP